ncbi:hypothetical protein DPMN_155253 [Dreissena polymorpha]|uniref:Uncharacterized protein n=1 Tax=Dreissena polymorpha TaxID=45954 RepID=A0A9D4FNI8_DREPO|nr:hypothetical protein DPMN_155253 [Dreissena polymorpha]
MTLPLRPVVSCNIASRPRTTSPLTSGWVVPATAPIYRPTPKAACPMVALQVPAVSLATPTSVIPGTPLQDELVLRLDDDYSLDFLEEEPLVPLAFTSSGAATTASEEVRHTPAKQARLSPVPPANACNEEPKRSQSETADAAESEKLQILRNLQKMASDMTTGVERIAREMSRHNRLLDKQTDLLYRITNAVLQIRDDINKKESHKENRPSMKSVAKSVKK